MTPLALKRWRKSLRLSQPRAAKALNTPVGTYRNWEQGRRVVPGAVALLTKYVKQNWQFL